MAAESLLTPIPEEVSASELASPALSTATSEDCDDSSDNESDDEEGNSAAEVRNLLESQASVIVAKEVRTPAQGYTRLLEPPQTEIKEEQPRSSAGGQSSLCQCSCEVPLGQKVVRYGRTYIYHG